MPSTFNTEFPVYSGGHQILGLGTVHHGDAPSISPVDPMLYQKQRLAANQKQLYVVEGWPDDDPRKAGNVAIYKQNITHALAMIAAMEEQQTGGLWKSPDPAAGQRPGTPGVGPQSFEEAAALYERRLAHGRTAAAHDAAPGSAGLARPEESALADRVAWRSRQHGIAQHAAEQAAAMHEVTIMACGAARWAAEHMAGKAEASRTAGNTHLAERRTIIAARLRQQAGQFDRACQFAMGRQQKMVGIRKALAREIAPNAAAMDQMERVAERQLAVASTPPAPGNVTAALVQMQEQNGMGPNRAQMSVLASQSVVQENAMAGYGQATETPGQMDIVVDQIGKAATAMSDAVNAVQAGDDSAAETSLGVSENHLNASASAEQAVGLPAGLEGAPGTAQASMWWNDSTGIEKAAVIGGAGLGILFILKSLILRV
jgi:hypothetical protein